MQPSQTTQVENTLEVCPSCGYDGGFHVLLERRDDVPKTDVRLHLKCPGCRATLDVGWVSHLAD